MLFDPSFIWTFEGHEPQGLRDNINLSTAVTTCIHDNAVLAEKYALYIIKKSPNKQET